jgi:cytoskeletal protein RodZ
MCLDLPGLRETKGISLREIAETTKISLRFLQAIEDGEFAKLPGGIYNTSYIRQYARAIDFEESELLACYNSSMALRQ